MAGDNPLQKYNEKRRFGTTPEPPGELGDGGGNSFVVQKHRARRLHYDFRLEVDGVMPSWAVPKGPSYDPQAKRLAVHVEDHPLDYRTFEGNIPGGEYGAGSVIVWDTGTYRNVTDDGDTPIEEGLKKGHVRFVLDGEKLRGTWALTRFRSEDQWLLVKTKDDSADARRNPVKSQPRSVKTGRTIDEVAEQSES